MTEKIVTYFDIMDEKWCAYFDETPDGVKSGKFGFGDTEEEAIQYLKDLKDD